MIHLRSVITIIFVALIFAGISLWYHSPSLFYEIFFHNASLSRVITTTEYLFTPADSGITAVYPVGKEFTVVLDEQSFPRNDWKISCSPTNILRTIGPAYLLIPPLYGFHYESMGAGVCTVKNNSFSVTVRLVGNSS